MLDIFIASNVNLTVPNEDLSFKAQSHNGKLKSQIYTYYHTLANVKLRCKN